MNKDEINFTQGFEDLHLTSYKKIMEGKGFGIKENFNAIDTVSKIRNAKTLEQKKNYKIFKRFITMIKNFVHETSIIDEGAIIGKE